MDIYTLVGLVMCAFGTKGTHFRKRHTFADNAGNVPILDIFRIKPTRSHHSLNTPKTIEQFDCVPIKSKTCTDLTYSLTTMPNHVGSESQSQADRTVEQYDKLIQSGCHVHLKFFICSSYFPLCMHRSGIGTPPCRWVCNAVMSKCRSQIKHFGLRWPSSLECSNFPTRNCLEAPVILREELSRVDGSLEVTLNEPQLPHDDTIPLKEPNPVDTDISVNPGASFVLQDTESQLQTGMFAFGEGSIVAESPPGRGGLSADKDVLVPLEYDPSFVIQDTGSQSQTGVFTFGDGSIGTISSSVSEDMSSNRGAVVPLKSNSSFVLQDSESQSETGITFGEDVIAAELPSGSGRISASSRKCETVKLEMCQDLGYTHTIMPNLVGNINQTQVEAELKSFELLLKNNCHKHLRTFLCSAYLPVCSENKSTNFLTSCKSVCESVRSSCEPMMEWFSARSAELEGRSVMPEWPLSLQCENFPEDNCISISNSGTSHMSSGDHNSIIFGTDSISAVKPTVYENVIPSTRPQICAPIKVDTCKGFGYFQTSMPNVMGHIQMKDAESELMWLKPLINLNCHEHVRFLLCSAFFPHCLEGASKPITSCRSVCRKVRKSCTEDLRKLGLDWPKELRCSKFPRFGLCMASPMTSEAITQHPTIPITNSISKHSTVVTFNSKQTTESIIENKTDSFERTESNTLPLSPFEEANSKGESLTPPTTHSPGNRNALLSGSSTTKTAEHLTPMICLTILFICTYIS